MSFSSAISPATTAIHARLITPSANSEAISAQQQPTHQAPWRAPISAPPRRPSRHEPSEEPERAAALAEADVLQRRQLVDRRDERASRRRPSAPPGPRRRRRPATAPATAERERPDRAPDEEVAAGEDERRQRRRSLRHLARRARPSARPTGTSSPPSSRPRRRGTSRASRGSVHGPPSMPCIWSAVHHQPTPASANSSATSPSRARAAANAGARPAPAAARAPRRSALTPPRRTRPSRGRSCPRTRSRTR